MSYRRCAGKSVPAISIILFLVPCDIVNRCGFCICQNNSIYMYKKSTFKHIILRDATFWPDILKCVQGLALFQQKH